MSDSVALIRCEHDPAYSFHCDALEQLVPNVTVYDLPAGDVPAVSDVGSVIISGSTAGVYEDRDWIETGREFVQELLNATIPTLGVCFGHQLVNDALGGTVEPDQFRAGLVEAQFANDPLFADVSQVVPIIHGDMVRESGDGLTPIASVSEYSYPLFATRHESAPIWTVQFHPELRKEIRPTLVEAFDWDEHGHSFDQVNSHRTLSNFDVLANQWTDC